MWARCVSERERRLHLPSVGGLAYYTFYYSTDLSKSGGQQGKAKVNWVCAAILKWIQLLLWGWPHTHTLCSSLVAANWTDARENQTDCRCFFLNYLFLLHDTRTRAGGRARQEWMSAKRRADPNASGVNWEEIICKDKGGGNASEPNSIYYIRVRIYTYNVTVWSFEKIIFYKLYAKHLPIYENSLVERLEYFNCR